MNVKAGQKAIIVKSEAGNEGKVVEVLEYLGENPFYGGYVWNIGIGPCWLISSGNKMLNNIGYLQNKGPIADAWLRPVSDIPRLEYEDEQIKFLENV